MTWTSFPAVGNDGWDELKWSQQLENPDGIINDYTGTGLALSVVSATNTAHYAPGLVTLNGYVFKISGTGEDLTVSTTAGTYYTAICYDPALNVPDGSGNANPDGPMRLVINTTLSTSGGKTYLVLDKFVRAASQALSATPVTRFVSHVGETLWLATMPAEAFTVPETAITGWGPFPIGTIIRTDTPKERYRRVLVSGTPTWVRTSVTGPTALPTPASLVAFDDPAMFYIDDLNFAHFQGTLKRSSGASLSNGADVVLATMTASTRSLVQIRIPCTVKKPSGWGMANVTVREDSGQVIMYDPGFDVDFVDLSAVTYLTRGF